MSVDHTPDSLREGGNTAMSDLGSKVSHKSYRRKYRKIMVQFEETMKESTSLFRDEQKILDISRRLAEQNDQILQLLEDLNAYPQIPPRLRYDLLPPGTSTDSTARSTTEYDTSSAQSALRKGRQQLRNGDLTLSDYRKLQDEIRESPAFVPVKSYKSLLRDRHAPSKPALESSNDVGNATSSGYLTAQQEEQYQQGLDSFLAGKSNTSRPHTASNQGSGGIDRSIERERELQLRNPVSVYNWLRKHQPQVFLQDNEVSADKPTRPPGSRVSKRALATTNATTKQEPELYDDDGIAMESGPGARKRKRERVDDPGYRYKGGYSRTSKRKKEEAPPAVKRSKKPSISES